MFASPLNLRSAQNNTNAGDKRPYHPGYFLHYFDIPDVARETQYVGLRIIYPLYYIPDVIVDIRLDYLYAVYALRLAISL
jgi:hypothetical protein